MPLRVLARGHLLVMQHEMAGASPRRFIGRTPRARENPPGSHPLLEAATEWHALNEPTELTTDPQYVAEYLREIRERALWPADEATAKAAGVPFDPTFGGEYPELTKPKPTPEPAPAATPAPEPAHAVQE